MDAYDGLTENYTGWTLSEIRGLTPMQRYDWMSRAERRIMNRRGIA